MIDQTDAGWRGGRHSPETRVKMSASARSHTGNTAQR
jgi:hypothetical protein